MAVPYLLGKVDDDELFDEDGYPSVYALALVRDWSWVDPSGWFDLVLKLWNHRDLGFQKNEEGTEVALHTLGWSGNEAIIRDMKRNEMLWSKCWQQASVGGHYLFQVERPE
jgi:hypothetical protein